MIFSPYQDCAIYQAEPPTFCCRRCGEVEHHKTANCSEEYCEACEAYWDAQFLSEVLMDDMMMRCE